MHGWEFQQPEINKTALLLFGNMAAIKIENIKAAWLQSELYLSKLAAGFCGSTQPPVFGKYEWFSVYQWVLYGEDSAMDSWSD